MAVPFVDANTVGAWRMSEAPEVPLTNYTTAADDGPNGFDLAQGPNEPFIIGGPGGTTLDSEQRVITDADYARFFGGTFDRGLIRTTNIGATRAAELETGPFTVQAWVKIPALPTSRAFFVGIHDASPGEANNTPFLFSIETDGRLRFAWQRGAGGTVEQVLQTTGTTVPLNTWVLISATVTENAGDWTVTLYIGSENVHSDTATRMSGGSTTKIVVARLETAGTEDYKGAIASWRVELEDRTSSIATDAAATDSRFTSTVNTWGLWNFQEEPSVADYSGNGHHLVGRNFSNANQEYGLPALTNAGNSVDLLGGANGGFATPTDTDLVATFTGAAEWTYECWMSPRQINTNDMGLMYFGDDDINTVEAENGLAELSIDWSGPKFARVDWQRDAGVAESDTGTVELFTDAEEFEPLYVAWVKRSIGGGQSEVDVYVGAGGTLSLVDTLGPLTDATGGTSIDAELFIGSTFFGSFSDTQAQRGTIQDARLSNIARTAQELTDCYNAGISGADTTAPQITNVVPATTETIQPGQPLQFDLTDETALIGPVVYAVIPPSDDCGPRWEVVHDSTAFAPGYTGTRTAITDGFQYVFQRDDGWPATPTIVVRAFDAGGNAVEVA